MRYLVHLARRFFTSLGGRRPGPADQPWIAAALRPVERDLFWSQPIADLAHATRGARHLREEAPDRPDLVNAFLLHDVGKRHARLGTMLRSFVTALAIMRLPTGSRGKAYLDHAARGADELESIGSHPLAIAFARHHHHEAPDAVAAADWSLLVAADHR